MGEEENPGFLLIRVFFKRAAMELWAVETTKWAVVNLNLGSCKINSLKIQTKMRRFSYIQALF